MDRSNLSSPSRSSLYSTPTPPPPPSKTPRSEISGEELNHMLRIGLFSARSIAHPSPGFNPSLSHHDTPHPKPVSDCPLTITDATRKINYHIIRSCATSALGHHKDALQEADYALYLAQTRGIYYLASKSECQLGLCFMELGRWREASWAFTRAANIKSWARRVPELKMEAERKMAEEKKVSRELLRRTDVGTTDSHLVGRE